MERKVLTSSSKPASVAQMKPAIQQFKEWRAKRKLSQNMAAIIIGVAVDTVRGWEQDKSSPSPMAQKAIREKCK